MTTAALGFFTYLFLGLALKKSKRLPDSTPAVLNAFILNLALPAMILLKVHSVQMKPGIAFAIAMPWFTFVFSWILFSKLGEKFRWSPSTTGAVILVSGLGNTSFIGFPMLESLFGAWALETGVLIDQLGSFLVFSTLAIGVASFYAEKSTPDRRIVIRKSLHRIVRFAPFWALIIALFLRPLEYPTAATLWLQRLADTLLPLALISVGFQWKFKSTENQPKNAIALSLGYKLTLLPLITFLLGKYAFPGDARTFQVTVAEAAMAPMINSAVLAQEFDLNPELAQRILTTGILLSFFTVPLWVSYLQHAG